MSIETYDIEGEDLDLTLYPRLICKKCSHVILSDQQEAIEHVMNDHNTPWGPYTHNIANLHFISLKEVTIKELEEFPTWT